MSIPYAAASTVATTTTESMQVSKMFLGGEKSTPTASKKQKIGDQVTEVTESEGCSQSSSSDSLECEDDSPIPMSSSSPRSAVVVQTTGVLVATTTTTTDTLPVLDKRESSPTTTTTTTTLSTHSGSSFRRRRPCPSASPSSPLTSILKPCGESPLLQVKESRGCWRYLPKLDMQHLQLQEEQRTRLRLQQQQQQPLHTVSEDNVSSFPIGTAASGGRGGISFGHVIIRAYSQTLGDNPAVSYGPPISLDWDYEEYEPILLEDYEGTRPPRRSLRQMVLSYYYRKNVLNWQYGFSEEQLKASKQQIKKERFQRQLTATFLPAMQVEAVMESAARKAKRMFGNKNKKTPKQQQQQQQ